MHGKTGILTGRSRIINGIIPGMGSLWFEERRALCTLLDYQVFGTEGARANMTKMTRSWHRSWEVIEMYEKQRRMQISRSGFRFHVP